MPYALLGCAELTGTIRCGYWYEAGRLKGQPLVLLVKGGVTGTVVVAGFVEDVLAVEGFWEAGTVVAGEEVTGFVDAGAEVAGLGADELL